MKHIFFTAAFAVISLLASGQVTFNVTKTTVNDCETKLNISVGGTGASNYRVVITVSPFPNGPFAVTTLYGSVFSPVTQYNVSPSNASTYHLKLEVESSPGSNSWLFYSSKDVHVRAQKCYFNYGAFSATGDDYAGYVFVPDNPNEPSIPGMQVKWKLEEVDMDDWDAVFTLENISCWTDRDEPGMTHTFDGFDAFDESSVSALQMGSCSSENGAFDDDKLYCVTRSCKVGNNAWEHYSMFVGAGSEDEEPAQRSASVTESETAGLFTLGQDREAKRILFNTTVDAGELVICDVAGNKLGTIGLQDGTFRYMLDVATYAKGVYLVQLQSGAQATVKKFMVE